MPASWRGKKRSPITDRLSEAVATQRVDDMLAMQHLYRPRLWTREQRGRIDSPPERREASVAPGSRTVAHDAKIERANFAPQQGGHRAQR